MAQRSTRMNALIGAVVTVVTSFIPLSPIIGGAVAGYLEGRDGGRIGAISGAMAAIPMLLFGLVMLIFVPVGMGMGMGIGPGLGMAIVMLFGLVLVLLYTAGLSAVGGLIGVYVAEERGGRNAADDDVEPTPAEPETSAD